VQAREISLNLANLLQETVVNHDMMREAVIISTREEMGNRAESAYLIERSLSGGNKAKTLPSVTPVCEWSHLCNHYSKY
jgi:hypothetical protein